MIGDAAERRAQLHESGGCASMPPMPGSTISINTASKLPCSDAIRRRPHHVRHELGLMTKLGQDRIEHHTAERIVLDAQNAQNPAVILWTDRFVLRA